jgi:hypothetical protein
MLRIGVQFAAVGLRLGNSFTTTAKGKLFTQNADLRSNTVLRRKQMTEENYNAEEETAELVRVGKLPKPLRLAAMLEKTMQWPLHGKSADCLREMYELLQRCENEMRYAGWDKREADNYVRNDVYEQVKSLLEKNT